MKGGTSTVTFRESLTLGPSLLSAVHVYWPESDFSGVGMERILSPLASRLNPVLHTKSIVSPGAWVTLYVRTGSSKLAVAGPGEGFGVVV